MKRIYIICLMLLVVGVKYSSAQWTSDITTNTFTSTSYLTTGDAPKISAGKTTGSFVTWVGADTSVNQKTCLYAQAFDKNGNRLWGAKGVCIDTLMGITRFKYDQKVDNNGDLIVGTQNTRFGINKQFPVIYKLNKTTGQITWKKEINDTANTYISLAPSLCITGSNNVLVAWTKIRILADSSETTDACVQKLDPLTGNYMFTQAITITDPTNVSGNSIPQVILSGTGENFLVASQLKVNAAGLAPYNVLVQRYNGSSATPTAFWTKPASIASTHLLVTGSNVNMMTNGSSGAVITYPVAGKVGGELYGQYIDLNGNLKWGTDALLLATNPQGSANAAGVWFDANAGYLWFSIVQDKPTTSIRSQTIYLQGVDASGNFLRNGYTTAGLTVLPYPADNVTMTSALTLQGLDMKSTNDGLIVTYLQGSLPTQPIVKAVKVDTVGRKVWPGEDSITLVSTRVGLSGGTVSDFVDGQLVVAMSAIPTKVTNGNVYEIVQNINSNGTVGVNSQRQIVSFNTDTVYVVYGDAPYPLNATANSGIPPIYTISDPTLGSIDSAGYVHFLDVGTFTVSPFFPSNSTYMAKQGHTKVFIVTKGRTLKVIADNNTKQYGWLLPTLTMHFETFANGDDAYSAFTKLPTIYSPATKDSPVGVYPITLEGGVSTKYFIELVNAKLTVYPQGGKDKDNMDAYCSSPNTLQVIIYSLENQTGPMQLVDMGGRIVWTSSITVNQGVNNYQVPISSLSAGIYVVRFASKSGEQLNQKVRIK